MSKAPLATLAGLVASALLSSCVGIDNQIAADELVDERLIGVWKIVRRSPDEVIDTESPRYEDDFGVYEAIIIGRADDSTLILVAIDGFSESGAHITGHFSVKTREHEGKRFLLLEMLPFGVPHPDDDWEWSNYVMEYEINENGDLFIWCIDPDMFDGETDLPPLPYRIEGEGFGQSMHITATADEVLEFLVDPRVSEHMISVGKYRKMVLPEGNSPPMTEDPPKGIPHP